MPNNWHNEEYLIDTDKWILPKEADIDVVWYNPKDVIRDHNALWDLWRRTKIWA